jgi:hypothetical protein
MRPGPASPRVQDMDAGEFNIHRYTLEVVHDCEIGLAGYVTC